ncbi:MAG: AMP-binding protein [Sphingobacteriaceae bacterium]|nr:AMP-binding protein [Cytophagaceae bacterium]
MILPNLLQTALAFPEKEALVSGARCLTYATLVEEVLVRGAKIRAGFSEKTLILAQSDPTENLIDLLGAMAVGKTAIFASRQVVPAQIKQLLTAHHAALLDDATAAYLPDVAPLSAEEICPAKPGDRFLGVLTSGTEAAPRVIFKDYQCWVSAFPHQSDVFGIGPDDRLLVLDALGYSANLNAALHLLWQGGTVVLTTLASAGSWLRQIEEHRISSVFMVPSHYRLWATKKGSMPGLKSLVSAGEKLDATTARGLLTACPNTRLTEYYGAAELGHVSYHQNDDILRYGYSVGRAFPGVDIRIHEQQILVESPYVSPDFRGVNSVFDLGAWEGERLVLLGRSGRMFNRRGLNVFAEELESQARQLPFVREVAAVGKRRADGSHDLFVAFSARHPHAPTVDYGRELRAFLLKNLPPAKQPRRTAQFANLPRRDTGKIDYEAVLRLFGEEDSSSTSRKF